MTDMPPTEDGSRRSGSGSANAIDRHVGLQVRLRRKEAGLTQEALGETLGVTAQQIQKYERGANRISASTLWRLGRLLNTPIDDFFADLPASLPSSAALGAPLHHAFMFTREGEELVRTFPRLTAPSRRTILALLQALVEPDHDPRAALSA